MRRLGGKIIMQMEKSTDIEKLTAMVHYACTEFKGKRDKLNRTKLMKILWFSDGEYLQQAGKTISGFDAYLKYPNGPFLTEIYDAEKQLEKNSYVKPQEIMIEKNKNMKEIRYILQTSYQKNLYRDNFLNEKERKIIFAWATELSGETAQSASDISHEYWWDDFNMRDPIPVYMRIKLPSSASLTKEEVLTLFKKMAEQNRE